MSETPISGNVPSFSTIEELEALVRESDQDGESIEMTSDEWRRLHDTSERDSQERRKAS
jgi:hypothetical protein